MTAPTEENEPGLPPKGVVVTHESAPRTQLDTAIYLWFSEGDPLSIHTLASAALQLLHDQGMKVGKPSAIIAGFRKLSKNDRRKLELPTVFAKHADRRMPFNTLDFPPQYTEHLMYEAAICYGNLFHDLSPWMRLFAARFTLTNPKLFEEVGIPESFKRLGSQEHLARLSRRKFLDEILPTLTRADLGMPDNRD